MSMVHSPSAHTQPATEKPVVSGHTPGPWVARKAHSGIWDVFAGDRDVVTVMGGGIYPPANEANARLIAAAPDLWEALDGIVHFTDGFGFYRTQSPAGLALEGWIEAAREALAKATTAVETGSVGTEAKGRSAPTTPPVKTGEG